MSLIVSELASNNFMPWFSIPTRNVLSPYRGMIVLDIMDIMLCLPSIFPRTLLIFPVDESMTRIPLLVVPIYIFPVLLSSVKELNVSCCSAFSPFSQMSDTFVIFSVSMISSPPFSVVIQSLPLLSLNTLEMNSDGSILLMAFCVSWSILQLSASIT